MDKIAPRKFLTVAYTSVKNLSSHQLLQLANKPKNQGKVITAYGPNVLLNATIFTPEDANNDFGPIPNASILSITTPNTAKEPKLFNLMPHQLTGLSGAQFTYQSEASNNAHLEFEKEMIDKLRAGQSLLYLVRVKGCPQGELIVEQETVVVGTNAHSANKNRYPAPHNWSWDAFVKNGFHLARKVEPSPLLSEIATVDPLNPADFGAFLDAYKAKQAGLKYEPAQKANTAIEDQLPPEPHQVPEPEESQGHSESNQEAPVPATNEVVETVTEAKEPETPAPVENEVLDNPTEVEEPEAPPSPQEVTEPPVPASQSLEIELLELMLSKLKSRTPSELERQQLKELAKQILDLI